MLSINLDIKPKSTQSSEPLLNRFQYMLNERTAATNWIHGIANINLRAPTFVCDTTVGALKLS